MMYQEKKPAEVVRGLAKGLWNEKESLRAQVRGFAVSERKGTVIVYLSQPLTDVATRRVRALAEGVDVEFQSIGTFHLTGPGPGAKLRRKEGYSGRLAAYVRGVDGRHYALTCGHVLHGIPRTSEAADVIIQGSHHPAKFAVKSVFDFKANGVNLVDGALAELYPSAIAPHNHLPDGSALPTTFASYGEGDKISHVIGGGKTGTIESTSATLLVTVGASELTLNDMIIAKSTDGSQFVKQGDSGSLFVKTSDKRPVGMLLAKAKSADGGPSDLAILCPLERTLDLLSQLDVAKEHYPGPFQLV